MRLFDSSIFNKKRDNLTYTKECQKKFLLLLHPGYGGLSWDRSLLSHRRRNRILWLILLEEETRLSRIAFVVIKTLSQLTYGPTTLSLLGSPLRYLPLCADWPSRRSCFTWLRTTIHQRWSETARSFWSWPYPRSTRKLYTGRRVLTVSISPLRKSRFVN